MRSWLSANNRGFLKGPASVSGGRVNAAAADPTPPGAPLHWFDFTDVDYMFEDEAGTNAVESHGDAILRIDNKGSSSEHLSVASESPLYHTMSIPTITPAGVAYFDSSAALKTGLSDLPTDWEHYSTAIVVSSENVEAFQAAQDWDTFESSWAFGGNDAISWYTQNTEPVTGSGGLVNDTFYAFIAINDDEQSAGNQSIVHQSHTESVAEADTELADGPAAGDEFAFGEQSDAEGSVFAGHIAEYIMWNAILTAEEIADYKAYITAKYGVVWA